MSERVNQVVVVKLGGSLITDKRGDAVARVDVIERLAGEIAAAWHAVTGRLILSHGSGSFGHVTAARHGVGRGPLERGALAGAGETRLQAARLHELVVGRLLAAGLPAFSWAPSSAMTARAGRPASADVEPLLAALAAGFLPVTYGDVVLDLEWGASIASTEAVVRTLAGRLERRGTRIDRVFWLGATRGIYDSEGVPVERVDRANHARIRRMIGATAGTDVTGGMLLRLDTARWLARRGIESWVVDGRTPGLLAAGLSGEPVPGTRFVADV